jgi:hypothetical protein
MKPPGHRPGIRGKVVYFHIVSLDPAYPALAGRGTSQSRAQEKELLPLYYLTD